MVDRPAKLRRLDHMRRKLPHMSMSAMSAVPKDFDDNGPLEIGTSRKQMTRARDAQLEETPYGSMLTEINLKCNTGGDLGVAVLNPFS